MKKCFSVVFILATYFLSAQDSTINLLKKEANRTINIAVPDSIKKNWIKGGLLNLNIAQGSLKNWAAGGEDFSLALNLYTNGHAYYRKNKVSWDNNVDINIGYIRTASSGTRKTDDRFDFLSKYGYALNSKISASALFDLRTQFFDGFTYSSPDVRVFSSTAFAPAYILLSPGFDYKPVKTLSIFISPITSRWIIVVNPTLSKTGAYGVDSGKHYINQLGAFGTVIFNSNFSKNITFNSRTDLFSNYEHNPQDIDVYMTNLFTAKISKIFSATWNVDLIYDDDVRLFGPNHDSPRLQVKSLIGLGILIKVGM